MLKPFSCNEGVYKVLDPCTPPRFSRDPAESFKTVPSTNMVQSLLNTLICS